MRQLWFTILTCLLCWCALSAQDNPRPVRNIVLVHGAWADGSGWKGVYDILVKDGYAVSIVQEPETSFQEDVAATTRVLAQQDGPCILVAHSYGGAVITEAGNDSRVVGLVYIAAHMPDRGESEAEDGKRFPSDLSKSNALKRTAAGFTYLDPAQFHEYFAADLSFEQASFMARSQVLNFADNFTAVIANAAWRTKPSWMAVATKDRIINPDLERWYATRSKSHTVEIAGASHAVYVSRPQEVAAVIEDAASHALDPAADKEPLDAQTLDTIKSEFGKLMELANRHDFKALHGMFWQSPSALLVAKSAIPSEGNWAGFWGNEAIDQKLHDIGTSGPVVLEPDYSQLKVVGLTPDVAESFAPMDITVSYAGQDGTPKPFLMIINWIRVGKDWKVASEIILPVPPAPAAKG